MLVGNKLTMNHQGGWNQVSFKVPYSPNYYMILHSYSEEIFRNIQLEAHLMQFEAAASSLIVWLNCNLWRYLKAIQMEYLGIWCIGCPGRVS